MDYIARLDFKLLFCVHSSKFGKCLLRLILRIITYLTYICWEIDNFVIKSDIFRRFFICKNILKKLSCYHDNYFRYFMFGKYNGFVSKARVSACMYFLVLPVYNRWEICLSTREQNTPRNCVEYTQRVFTKSSNCVNIAKCLVRNKLLFYVENGHDLN